MKALKVPVFLQSRHKPHCGPVCAKMVLSFYKEPLSLIYIIRNLRLVKTGVDIVGLGTFFLKQGFRVVLIVDLKKAVSVNIYNAKNFPEFLSRGGGLMRRSVRT